MPVPSSSARSSLAERAAQKLSEAEKWKLAAKKAQRTDKWTEVLFRALVARVAHRWKFVSFRGEKGGEWAGIVDVLAVRKNTARSEHEVLQAGDLFDLILVQMKGGRAEDPKEADVRRLLAVKKHYRAKEIVLFRWDHRASGKVRCTYKTLDERGQWQESSATGIFGKRPNGAKQKQAG